MRSLIQVITDFRIAVICSIIGVGTLNNSLLITERPPDYDGLGWLINIAANGNFV